MKRQEPDYFFNAWIFKEWNLIHSTRKYLNDLIYGQFKDHLYAEKVATASSELIENAYKYSPVDSDFNIRLKKEGESITLEVRNFVEDEVDKTLAFIQDQIDVVYGLDNPQEAFTKKMMASINDPSGKSMLGFAKIRLETGAQLAVTKIKEDLISIKAKFNEDDKS